MKTNTAFIRLRVLILVALILTAGAAGAWGYVFYKQQQVANQQQGDNFKRKESSRKYAPNFSVVFDTASLATKAGEVDEMPINFAGSLTDVSQIKVVINFDPKEVEVTDFNAGENFSEIGNVEKSEGQLAVILSKPTDKNVTSGQLGSIVFSLKEGVETARISIVEDDLIVDPFSGLTTTKGVFALGGSTLIVSAKADTQ